MADFKTHITDLGFKKLLEGGFVNNITSFRVGDESIIYGINDGTTNPSFFDYPIVGNREGTTTIPVPIQSQNKFIPVDPLTTDEILATDRRVRMSFISEDCDISFEKNNVTIKVNLDKWIDDLTSLKSSAYTRTVSGIKINFWDYILAELEEYNLTSSDWDVKEQYISNLDIVYNLLSDTDEKNYDLINPKFMRLNSNGTKQFINKQGTSRFSSPMILNFGVNVIEGVEVYGTSSTLSLYPDKWGYLVDGTFYNAGDFEDLYLNGDQTQYTKVYPAVNIDGTNYWLRNDTDYRSVDGTGYLVYGYKDTNGNPAIDGITNKIKLFMKSNGEQVSTGLYKMSVNLNTRLFSDVDFKNAADNKFIGGNITFEFSYNENTVSSDLYTVS
jgi:hypothetical protein